MFETETPRRSNLQVFLGFLFGCVVALACLFLSIFLAWTLSARREWIFPALTAVGLIIAGAVCLKHARTSSIAAGMVLALSIALLLDGACAVAFLK